MDAWEIALWAAAAYIAIAAIVRLMRAARDREVAQLRAQFEAERLHQKQLEKKKKQASSGKEKAA